MLTYLRDNVITLNAHINMPGLRITSEGTTYTKSQDVPKHDPATKKDYCQAPIHLTSPRVVRIPSGDADRKRP